jgi:hypothetical protein
MRFNGLVLELVRLDSETLTGIDRDSFQCTTESVTDYFRKSARKHSVSGYAQTYVLKEVGSRKVIGFFAVCPTEIQPSSLPTSETRGLPGRRLPALLLAQFGIDQSSTRMGFGHFLLLEAIKTYHHIQKLSGGKVFVLDLENPDLASFYAELGFTICVGESTKMFLTVGEASSIVEASRQGQQGGDEPESEGESGQFGLGI